MKPQELQTWRRRNGYSQKQLANVLGVTNVCISRWEHEAREIPSFLHLALECLERRGGEKEIKGNMQKKTKKKGVKK